MALWVMVTLGSQPHLPHPVDRQTEWQTDLPEILLETGNSYVALQTEHMFRNYDITMKIILIHGYQVITIRLRNWLHFITYG